MESQNNKVCSYEFATITKDMIAIEKIIQSFKVKGYGTQFTLESSQKYSLNQSIQQAFILIIDEGCFSVGHFHNGLYMSTMFSPTVIGLIDGYGLSYEIQNRPIHYIYTETECTGFKIPLSIFIEKCEELHLWREVARLLAHRLMVMSLRDEELVGSDAYSMIRVLLIELWLYPENIRQQIKVAPFIQRRTGISRSRVMKVLQELRNGSYIELTSGVLANLQNLPLSF